MKKVIKITESQLTNIVKKLMNEETYNDYLDTNYDSDGMDDYYSDKKDAELAGKLYDIGHQLYIIGKKEDAEKYRQEALQKGSFLGWDDNELPPYE